MSSGTKDTVEGKLKEAGGALLGDEKMKKEGQAQKAVGKVKDMIEDSGKAASDLVEKAADMLKGK